ncbi:MAG TPA: flagellar FlbD family protein [Cellulomonas sp.]|uniref:flagellar FlbD family protein n=1 Tax=Cellulomonas sp. TaxID=40001 RepID=UPI002E307308|nr:flagellar FlbD family protein [Cellulomonas sp.]HEX5333679.1 flagellar FlbD family protein [Cellulomonas sp.]
MIVVTRLNGPQFGVNPDLLQRIDSAPDTILTLIDGTKYIVEESMTEVIELVNEHRSQLLARAHDIQLFAPPSVELVRDRPPVEADDEDDDVPLAPPVQLHPRTR